MPCQLTENRSTNWKTPAKNGKWKREMEKRTMAPMYGSRKRFPFAFPVHVHASRSRSYITSIARVKVQSSAGLGVGPEGCDTSGNLVRSRRNQFGNHWKSSRNESVEGKSEISGFSSRAFAGPRK